MTTTAAAPSEICEADPAVTPRRGRGAAVGVGSSTDRPRSPGPINCGTDQMGRVRSLSQAHAHGLDLGVQVDDLVAPISRPAGLLARRRAVQSVEDVLAVDPDGAGVQPCGHGECPCSGPSSRSRSRGRRSSLAAGDTSVSREKGWAVTTGPKISSRTTFIVGLVSTSTVGSMKSPGPSIFRPPLNAQGPLGEPGLDVAPDPVQLLLGHQRAHLGGRIHARADLHPARLFGYSLGHLVEGAVLDVQPRPGRADLAVVEEDRACRTGNRLIHVGVGEHHVRRLAAQFQRHLLQVARRSPMMRLPTAVEPVKAILSTSIAHRPARQSAPARERR